jgi:hypothetical protein
VITAINPSALAALRIAAILFPLINLVAGGYVFRNRHRFFGTDPDVSEDRGRSQIETRGRSDPVARFNRASCDFAYLPME